MKYLLIDTCVWINMLKKPFSEDFKILKELLDSGKIKLLLPTIIYEEFIRNKEKTIIDYIDKQYNKDLKELEEINNYLDKEDKKNISQIISGFRNSKDILKEKVLEQISEIENIFESDSCRKIVLTDNVKEQVIEYALKKKAPFQKANSIGDAMLFLGAIDYIGKYKIKPVIFVTDNSTDFSKDKDEKEEIHSDLEELLNKHDIKYEIYMSKLLRVIQKETIENNSCEIDINIDKLEKAMDNPNIIKIVIKYEKGSELYKLNSTYIDKPVDVMDIKESEAEDMLIYLKNFIPDKYKNDNFKIGIINDIEFTVHVMERGWIVNLFKKYKNISLPECNIDGSIPIKFNKILYDIINYEKNVVIVGNKWNECIKITSALTSLFKPDWNILVVEDRRQINIRFGKESYILKEGEDRINTIINSEIDGVIEDRLDKIRTSNNNKYKKILLNVGNMTINKNYLEKIMQIMNDRKGCILRYDRKPGYYLDNNDVDEFFTDELKITNKEMVKSVDYIITLGTKDEKGYLDKIWQQKNDKWSIVEQE